MKKRIKQVAKWVIGLLAMLLAWLWIGGLDCEAPEDGDLLVSWSDKKVVLKDNAYYAMSKLCEMCEDKLEDDNSILQLYLNPGEDCYASGSYKSFMGEDGSTREIGNILGKYKDILAFYDRIAVEGNFAPLSGEEWVELTNEGFGLLHSRSIRPLLLARIKYAVMCGDFGKAAELFKNDIRLLCKICDNVSTLFDFSLGAKMICDSVDNISRLVNEYDFPEAVLWEINRTIADIRHPEKQSAINMLKRYYSTVRYCVLHEWGSYEMRRKWDVDFRDEWVYGIASDLFYRYSFHPNRTLSKCAETIRRIIATIDEDRCIEDCLMEKKRAAEKYREWRSIRFLFPNGEGEGWGVGYDGPYLKEIFQKSPLRMLSVRLQIAMKLHAAKFGKPAKTVLEMKEFLGDVPDRILGTAVSIDLDALKVSCGDSIVPIDVEKRPHAFPLICREGTIFTNDGKSFICFAENLEGMERMVIPELEDLGYFADINHIDAFLSPTNLKEVVMSSKQKHYAVEGNVIYRKRDGLMIRCLSGQETITIPECIKKVHRDAFEFAGDVKTIVCKGTLPMFEEYRNRRDSKLKRWWRQLWSEKTGWSQRRLRNTSKDCVVLVDGNKADAWTRYFLWKGEWQGRPIHNLTP